MRRFNEDIKAESRLQIVGYSTGDAFPFHKESQFNLAEIGGERITYSQGIFT
jgi:hypothetical protein